MFEQALRSAAELFPLGACPLGIGLSLFPLWLERRPGWHYCSLGLTGWPRPQRSGPRRIACARVGHLERVAARGEVIWVDAREVKTKDHLLQSRGNHRAVKFRC